jgi:hypothetical protein
MRRPSMKFDKNDVVVVKNPIIGLISFKNMSGKVTNLEDGWVWVSIFGIKNEIPFRERELVKTN